MLDAEILVAELIDAEEPPTTANEVTRSLETDPIPLPNSPEPVPATAKRLEPATLGEQFRDPKFLAALALTLLLVGAGWWWTQQDLDPFTAEPLRYGDSMEFTVRGGELLATDEWVTLLTEQLGLDEEVCKVDLEFSGSGSTRVWKVGQGNCSPTQMRCTWGPSGSKVGQVRHGSVSRRSLSTGSTICPSGFIACSPELRIAIRYDPALMVAWT